MASVDKYMGQLMDSTRPSRLAVRKGQSGKLRVFSLMSGGASVDMEDFCRADNYS